MTSLPSLDSVRVEGKRVLVRVDFNAPCDGARVTDNLRISAALPTLEALRERGARVILASHLGRPGGKVDDNFSMEPIAAELASLWTHGDVLLADDVCGASATHVSATVRDGQLALVQNLRFEAGETKDDASFAREMAKLGDVYVNDAFGAAHRAHASVSALPKLFRERAAGLLLTKEVETLERIQSAPERPYVAVLGGAKVSDKIGVIESLLERVDTLLVGGAMANTFFAAMGMNMGRSLVEKERLPLARSVLEKAESRGVELRLPTDVVAASSLDATETEVCSPKHLAESQMALDVGPQTVESFGDVLKNARTIFWNGPMGLFEKSQFAKGTLGVAKAAGESSAFCVVGGGDSVAAVRQAKLENNFDHVSTGGGASLEYLEGKRLPGLEALC